jgi:hypothetical protein
MNKRTLWIVATAVLVTAVLSSSIGAITVLAWPYTDVSPGDWFYPYVDWADWNGVVTGYPDGTFRPNNAVSRAEAVTMLKAEAAFMMPMGIHVGRGASDEPIILDYFNNVDDVGPTIIGGDGVYTIFMNFNVASTFPLCTIDSNWTSTRNAVCNVYTFDNNSMQVRIWDPDTGYTQPAEFYIVFFGL